MEKVSNGRVIRAAVFVFASVVPLAAQQGAGLSILFNTGAGAAATGALHITGFAVQDGRAVALGTVSTSVARATGPHTVVTQVSVPVVSVASATANTPVPFAATTPTTFPVSPQATTGASAASPAVPGQAVSCGPLQLVLGPVRVGEPGLTLSVERVSVDISAGRGAASAQPAGALASALCSVDAALSQRATSPLEISTTTRSDVTDPGSSLQGVVAALNQVLAAL